MENWKEKKGDSTDTKTITISGITDYTDYYGQITILDPKSKETVGLDTALSPHVSDGFTVGLSPAHTAALDTGVYLVVFEVRKDDAGVITYRKELNWGLTITDSLINV